MSGRHGAAGFGNISRPQKPGQVARFFTGGTGFGVAGEPKN